MGKIDQALLPAEAWLIVPNTFSKFKFTGVSYLQVRRKPCTDKRVLLTSQIFGLPNFFFHVTTAYGEFI
jgi:hypothetical protein